MSHCTQAQQDAAQSEDSAVPEVQADHGSTGEGASSAMARLISQEQARIVPGAPEDTTNGSSSS